MDLFNKSNPFESHMFYIHDYAHGMVRLFSVFAVAINVTNNGMRHLAKKMTNNTISQLLAYSCCAESRPASNTHAIQHGERFS